MRTARKDKQQVDKYEVKWFHRQAVQHSKRGGKIMRFTEKDLYRWEKKLSKGRNKQVIVKEGGRWCWLAWLA